MNDICIRLMKEGDTNACATVHMRSFKGFFLTFLGHQFLKELYVGIVQDPGGITYVAEDQNRIVGFVAGVVHLSDLYRRLIRKRLWRFAWASRKALIQKPLILPRLLRAFRAPYQKDPVPNCGTLMSIGVLPEAQGLGIGQRLVQAFLTEARQRGLEHVVLTTDYHDNDSANRFYQRQGFTLQRTYLTPEGRRMNEYIASLLSG